MEMHKKRAGAGNRSFGKLIVDGIKDSCDRAANNDSEKDRQQQKL